MKIAITGGTGFVGRHLARALVAEGHEVVLLARGVDRRDAGIFDLAGARFVAVDLTDEEALTKVFTGCQAVAHCAGINREIGAQTYQRVHVESTRAVVGAAKKAGAGKIVLLSFLRARPGCGSAYHESKWAAEEILRNSGLDYTVLKSGMIYGRGDHMLDHLGHALRTFPAFATVGFREGPIRPTAVEDVARILGACLVEGRLSRQTVAVIGPEQFPLSEAVRRVAKVIRRRVWIFPMPVVVHLALAVLFEMTMRIPLVARAQVRMLAEGIAEPLPGCDALPENLQPQAPFSDEQIRKGLPPPGGFGVKDCLLANSD